MSKLPAPDSPHADIIEKYANAVGLLTIYWATLENALIMVIERLLETDELTARCVAMSTDKATGRAALIQRLVLRPGASPSQEWADCMSGMCKQISEKLGPSRNRLVHDDWSPDSEKILLSNKALRIGKPSSREAKALLDNAAAPTHITDIYELTNMVVHTMIHITMQSLFWAEWRRTGKLPRIPEQAIRLSKGLPATPPQQEGLTE